MPDTISTKKAKPPATRAPATKATPPAGAGANGSMFQDLKPYQDTLPLPVVYDLTVNFRLQ